jgi:hypothetical protein
MVPLAALSSLLPRGHIALREIVPKQRGSKGVGIEYGGCQNASSDEPDLVAACLHYAGWIALQARPAVKGKGPPARTGGRCHKAVAWPMHNRNELGFQNSV